MARTASKTAAPRAPRASKTVKAAAIPAEQVSEVVTPEQEAAEAASIEAATAALREAAESIEAPAAEQAPEQAPEAPAADAAPAEQAPAPVEVPAEAAAFKPKRINPAREDMLIAMAEAPDGGAQVWNEQPKTREGTKAALLDGAFVTHDGHKATITPKGRAFATFAALHRAQVNPAPKAPKAEQPAKGKPGRPAKVQAAQAAPVKAAPVAQAAPSSQDGSKLAAIITGIYGVNFLEAPALTLIWAATQMIEIEGKEVAKAELSALNTKREAAGKIPAYAPYGSLLF